MLWLLLACAGDKAVTADDTAHDSADADADTDTDADTDADTDTDTDTDTDVGPTPPGDGVLLYTGDGGGGPGTDLYPTAVEAVFDDAGIPVLLTDSLPAGWIESYGVLVLLNPTTELSSGLSGDALSLVERGGRLVIGFERTGWGNTGELNGLLGAVGSTMITVSDQSSGGAASLTIADVGALTSGVSELKTFYSASVDVGEDGAIALGADSAGVAVVGYEAVSYGDVVVVADSSFFGYYIGQADNTRFIQNFASLR